MRTVKVVLLGGPYPGVHAIPFTGDVQEEIETEWITFGDDGKVARDLTIKTGTYRRIGFDPNRGLPRYLWHSYRAEDTTIDGHPVHPNGTVDDRRRLS